ncbi:hypothetical protein AC579_4215 [Pseudocercospora musae]|uniref:Extracellular membrane protein CFEM domain-containing protein n=1 Tax=Pseudocercospora musae TaxID=113226 RepID=A0A139ID63_9PEZI|nr:hypothetical protein AC579_4215 [Pseudocercospora musae]
MRFSTLATLFALMVGAFAQGGGGVAQAQTWNCDLTSQKCIYGRFHIYNDLKCSDEHKCKTQGNGCIPKDSNGDGIWDYANCS